MILQASKIFIITCRFYCRFFLNRFFVCCNLFVLLFLVTPCVVVAVQSCMEGIPIKKNKVKPSWEIFRSTHNSLLNNFQLSKLENNSNFNGWALILVQYLSCLKRSHKKFCPISLLLIFGKFFERLVLNSLFFNKLMKMNCLILISQALVHLILG